MGRACGAVYEAGWTTQQTVQNNDILHHSPSSTAAAMLRYCVSCHQDPTAPPAPLTSTPSIFDGHYHYPIHHGFQLASCDRQLHSMPVPQSKSCLEDTFRKSSNNARYRRYPIRQISVNAASGSTSVLPETDSSKNQLDAWRRRGQEHTNTSSQLERSCGGDGEEAVYLSKRKGIWLDFSVCFVILIQFGNADGTLFYDKSYCCNCAV